MPAPPECLPTKENVERFRSQYAGLFPEDSAEHQHALTNRITHLFGLPIVDEPAAEPDPLELLSEDERRMVKAYRQARARHASGTFGWAFETSPGQIVTPEDVSLIIDPNDRTRAS